MANKLLLKVTQEEDEQQITTLLKQQSINVNITNSSSLSSLLICAKNGNLKIMKLLTENEKCDINHKTFSGETALHLAAKHSNLECCDWLIQKNIDACAKDNEGNTALVSAAKIWPPRTNILQLLASKSPAIVNIPNDEGVGLIIFIIFI